MIGSDNLFQGFSEVSHQRAADAAGVHLPDLHPSLLQETAVDPDLTEFVLNEHHLLPAEGLRQQLFNQRSLSGPQEPGNNVNLCHLYHPFLRNIRGSRRTVCTTAPRFFHFIL